MLHHKKASQLVVLNERFNLRLRTKKRYVVGTTRPDTQECLFAFIFHVFRILATSTNPPLFGPQLSDNKK